MKLDSSTKKTNNFLENEYVDIDNIFKGIFIRRKKYLIYIGTLSFLIVLGITIFNRIFRPVYLGTFTILINDPMNVPEKKQYRPDDKELFEKLATNATDNDIPTLIEYLRSPLLIKPLAKKYGYNTFNLIKHISINNGDVSSKNKPEGILKIELLTKKPKKDINLLKNLSTIYLQTSLAQRQQRLKDGLDFLDQQEPILQRKNNELQSELVNFREKFLLIEPESEGLSLKVQEDKLKEELLNISSEKNRLLIVRKEVLDGTISATGFVDEINSTKKNLSLGLKIKDYDQSLINQIFALENDIAKKRVIFTEDSKTLKKLKANLEKFKPALKKSQLQAVDTAIRLNNAKAKDIQDKLNSLKLVFSEKPELIKKFNSLKQKLDISERNLFGLVSARENFQLKIAQSSVPWKIIQEPYINNKPIKPSMRDGLFISLIIGFLSGVLSAFIRDRFDYVYHNKKEISDFIDKPIIGEIPNFSIFNNLNDESEEILEKLKINNLNYEKTQRKNLFKEKFLFEEALRNLYSSIKFLSKKNKIKILTISSSLPNEGKTLISIMFAKILSDLGKKVLLIDGDLRKPTIHLRFNLDNQKGLSTFLTNENLDYKKIIQNVEGVNNLDVISSGPQSLDPHKILSTKKMKNLFDTLSESKFYDYVLYDGPQILGISDSLINLESIDGLILLISLRKVSKNIPLEAIERIEESNTTFLGVLPNAISENDKLQYLPGKYGYGYSKNDYALSEYYFQNLEKNENNTFKKSDDELNQDDQEKNKYWNKYLFLIKGYLPSNLTKNLKLFLIWLDK